MARVFQERPVVDFDAIQFETARTAARLYADGSLPLTLNPQIRWGALQILAQRGAGFTAEDMSRWSGQSSIPKLEVWPGRKRIG